MFRASPSLIGVLTALTAASAGLLACGGAGVPGAMSSGTTSGATATLAPDPCKVAPTPTVSPGGDNFCTGLASESVLSQGLEYGDITVGTGPAVTTGEKLRVNYTGWLQATGAMFDSSRQPGRQPFEFVLGAGQVIVGWDEGLHGLHVGGKRRLIIPPALAYGTQGRPPTIPTNATLVFDIEVLAVVT